MTTQCSPRLRFFKDECRSGTAPPSLPPSARARNDRGNYGGRTRCQSEWALHRNSGLADLASIRIAHTHPAWPLADVAPARGVDTRRRLRRPSQLGYLVPSASCERYAVSIRSLSRARPGRDRRAATYCGCLSFVQIANRSGPLGIYRDHLFLRAVGPNRRSWSLNLCHAAPEQTPTFERGECLIEAVTDLGMASGRAKVLDSLLVVGAASTVLSSIA
jgi:hypothetical protein